MNTPINFILLSALILMQGCTSPASSIQSSLHTISRQECYKNPNTQELQQCLEQHSQPYNPKTNP